MLVARIAISKYYKTRNGFWTLKVTRTQSVKIFFKCIFQISPPSLWRISMLVTRIVISKYYKTRNGFLVSRGHQDTVCEDSFFGKIRISNFTSIAMANFYTCDPHYHT